MPTGKLPPAPPFAPAPAVDGTAKLEPLAHKTPDDIDSILRQAVVDAVSKPRDEARELSKMPLVER